MILGANHIAISVPNMGKALEFYRDMLGLEQAIDSPLPNTHPLRVGRIVNSIHYHTATAQRPKSELLPVRALDLHHGLPYSDEHEIRQNGRKSAYHLARKRAILSDFSCRMVPSWGLLNGYYLA